MNVKICLIFFIVTALTHVSVGLNCYACSSSSQIFDIECANGTKNVRSGTCPSSYGYCVVRRYINNDGSTTVLRDCASGKTSTLNENLMGEGRAITSEYLCQFNLCNGASSAISRFFCYDMQWIWTIYGVILFYFGGIFL